MRYISLCVLGTHEIDGPNHRHASPLMATMVVENTMVKQPVADLPTKTLIIQDDGDFGWQSGDPTAILNNAWLILAVEMSRRCVDVESGTVDFDTLLAEHARVSARLRDRAAADQAMEAIRNHFFTQHQSSMSDELAEFVKHYFPGETKPTVVCHHGGDSDLSVLRGDVADLLGPCIDVRTLFTHWEDSGVPSLSQCAARAGIVPKPVITTVDGARQTIELLRSLYGGKLIEAPFLSGGY